MGGDDHDVIVRFDLPGVDPGSIDVTVDRNVLTVKAERQSDRQEGDEVVIAERPHGSYTRRLLLGDTLDTERTEAEYRDCVLTLTIPVAERATPRKVQIAAGEQQVQRIETATGTGQGQEGDQAMQTERQPATA